SISKRTVQKIVEQVDLYVMPLVNPDGREFCMTTDLDWRKTRHPVGTSATCQNPQPPPEMIPPVGTDPNRNYDISWDYQKYYSAAFEAAGNLSASKDPCNYGKFIGPQFVPHIPEPEIDNVQQLIVNLGVEVFVDIHSCGHALCYPWAMEDD